MPPGRDRLERRRDAAAPGEHHRVDGPVRRATRATWVGVDREHLVAPSLEHEAEEPADEAVADDQHAPRGHPGRAAEDTGERLDHRPAPVGPVVRELDPGLRADALREAAGPDRRLREPRTGGLVPREAALARAAGGVVDERDPAPVLELGHHLVAEDDAGVVAIELLDVRAAEPARDDPQDSVLSPGLGHVGERSLTLRPDDDGAHRRIVGSSLRPEGKEPSVALTLHRCPHSWIRLSGHPCWRVQQALDEMGVEYEVVLESWPFRSRRTALIEATGQSALPAIELDDGTWYREQSAEMARAIRAGRFGSPV